MNLFGTGANRICAVAAAATARQLQGLLRAGLRETGTVELRLDWLRDDKERHAFLGWLKKQRFSGANLMATCRRRVAGGEFASDAGAQLYWLIKARDAGCTWCDLEVETLRELPGESARGFNLPANVLISLHDFHNTPPLPKNLQPSKRAGAAAIKLAAMSRTLEDSARLLKGAHSSGKAAGHIVTVPMGEIGLPGRILALRAGSALAYAPVAATTAPGQVHLRELKYLYRAHELKAKTAVYGVIGNPIAHSLSPLMHNTGYIAAKKDAVFLPFLVENLGDFLKIVEQFGVRGFSVTLPYKQTIFRYLEECEPLAKEIGAVNTVTVRKDGSLYGSNTDYLGVLRALENKVRLRGSRVAIFGAGGSARAAAFALAKAGAEVFICARRPEAAKKLARAVKCETLPRAELSAQKFDAIINATPVGMHPHDGISPLTSRELNCSLVMDLIYRPRRTKLLGIAAKAGIATISGVEMFLAQGIAQWEHWMKARAPEAKMRQAVFAALKNEEQKQK
jgi:3-dehydroquinate dehydratase/shikimate dehydrogenase